MRDRTDFKEKLDALMLEAVESGIVIKSTFAGPSDYKFREGKTVVNS